MPTAKPRIWTVFLALVSALTLAAVLQAFLAVGLLLVEVGRGMAPQQAAEKLGERLMDPTMFIALAACGQLAFAICTLVPAWMSPVPFRQRLGLVPSRLPWTAVPLFTFGSMFVLAIGIGIYYLLPPVFPEDKTVEHLYKNMTLPAGIALTIFIAVVPGIVEELLFRGYVQRRLLERWSPFWALSVTAVIFASMHVMPSAIIALLPLSIYFGVIGWRAGSVIPTIFCHAWINGSLNAWRVFAKFADLSESTNAVVLSAATFFGAVCFALSLRYLWNAPTTENFESKVSATAQTA